VHVDDLVAALELVIREDHPGTFNVASDGWLTHEEARALLPRAVVPPFRAHTLERVLDATWSIGVGEIPPGVVPYLVHPWVITNDRLRALGWHPEHTNEQAILDGVASLPVPRRTPAIAFAAGAAAGAAIAAWATARSVRRARGARTR
jgi:nucleoside-diphosphate-sugar epimerase